MKKNAKKTLALDLQTVRALSGDVAGRVAGGSMGYCSTADLACSVTCATHCATCVNCPGSGGCHTLF